MILRSASVFIFASLAFASGCGSGHGTAASTAVSTSTTTGRSDPAPNLGSINPNGLLINSGLFSSQTFGASPKIAANQGYATDGTNNFLFSTAKIVQTDLNWNTLYTNSTPFSGIGIKVDHVGDGEVSAGRIYAPVACLTQAGCSPEAIAIGVYSADTAGLPLQQWANITSSGCDGSSIAVGPNNTLYVSSFFVNPDILCLYDATTLQSKGTLTLSTPIPRIQGISFDPASQRFAVTADDATKEIGYVYFVSLDGAVVGPAYTVPQSGELEGLDFTQGYIGYVIQPFDYVYFLYPVQLMGSNFYPASQVQFDGAAQTTTYESGEVLDAIVPASSLHRFGTFQVTVLNPAPGGGTSSALPFTVTASE